MGAMHPWSAAPEVAWRPRNLDVLRRNLITKFDVNQLATRSNPPDFGPSARNPRKVQIAVTMKFADIETIDRQFFKNQTLLLKSFGIM